MPESLLPDIKLIKEAQQYLQGMVNRTELRKSTTLSRMFNCELYLKMENHQKTGSFKSRGAIFRMSRLTPEERKAGVITASSGNHAQGVAYAAMINGIKAKIVMPEYSVPAKVNAVIDYGAEVVLYGSDYSDAREKAEELRKEEGRTFIEAFNCPYIISGQGTVGLEIYEDLPDAYIVIVPVGGGGLISGVATAMKSLNPGVKIVGVESELSDSMRESIAAGRIIPHTSGESIADGISVKYPGQLTLDICSRYLDSIVTVSDESIALAIYKLLERTKTLVEPSGAAGIAALMEKKLDVSGKKVVGVLSGGNINFLLLSKIIFKSMELESKLVRLEFKIPDRPGTLKKLSTIISESGGNVFHAEVDNLSEDTPVGFQTITFSVNVRSREHLDSMLEKIQKLGFRYKVLS